MSTGKTVISLVYLALTFIGFVIVTYPLFYFLWSFTDGSEFYRWTPMLSATFSFIAAVLYVRLGYSLGQFRTYVISFTLLAVLLGTTVTLLRVAGGPEVADTVLAVLFVFVYLIAYYLGYRSGHPGSNSSF